jgi:hypothetical protein
MTGTAVAAVLERILPRAAADILAVLIAGEVYDLTQLCGTDPPTDPTLTAQDVADALNYADPVTWIAGVAKVRQWFKSFYWYTVCECTGGSTPGAPTPSSPGDVVSNDPGIPSGPAGARCWDVTDSVEITNTPTINDIPQFLPATATTTKANTPVTGHTATLYTIPTGANNLVTVLTKTQVDPADSLVLELNFWNASLTPVATYEFGQGSALFAGFEQDFAIPPTATWWYLWCATSSATISAKFSMEFAFACQGQSPSTPITPCCPPDANLEARLNAIMGMVTSIYQSLPTPIVSLSDGTAHTGLTGAGTVTFAGDPLAVRVELTTIPASLGRDLASPAFLFDAGYLVPVIAGDPLREMRIVYQTQQVWLRALTDQVGYKLAPGVVATITELLRGP